MNRTLGSSAGFIALLVFVLHIAVPSGQEARSGAQAPSAASAGGAGAKAKKATSGATPTDDNKDVPREGPWLATRHFYGSKGNPVAPQNPKAPAQGFKNIDLNSVEDVLKCDGPSGCKPMIAPFFGIEDTEKGNIQFLLATVPDPLHTRLSLFTDSSLDAIQKAATDAGWLFATQWLPWNDTVDPDERDLPRRVANRKFIRDGERQPGVLVFRRHIGESGVLMIFIVGETPTAGINPAQFQLARAYMRAINEPDKAPIRIQAPTFSGSLYSLKKLIEEDSNGTNAGYLVRGTASDPGEGLKLSETKRVDFHSTESLGTFEDLLAELRIEPSDAAVLREDETDFGGDFVPGTRVFRFPRDISNLRNAYREAAQTASQDGAPTPDLDFSIKDSEIGEDSIPTFSKTQTPLSQSAVLSEITGAIRRDRIKIVEIAATNVLDRLFLARILKRQCPDTRLVISFPDLLFVEAAQTDALTGTLALSNYPLFMASNDWMGLRNLPYTFSGSNSEAAYHSTMMLLNPDRNSAKEPSLPRLPVWLLTLDREGFSPMRLRPGDDTIIEKIAAPGSPGLILPKPPALWTIVSSLAALTALSWLLWTFMLSRNSRPTLYAAFSVEAENTSPDRWRVFYLFLLALVLTTMEAVIYTPVLLDSRGNHVGLGWTLALLGILAALSCACWAFWSVDRRFLKGWIRSGLALAAFSAVIFLWVQCCSRSDQPYQSFFFSFRATELRIGTSPTWPVLAALFVLLLFLLVHLLRLYLAVYEKPAIMIDRIETALQPRLEEFYNRFNRLSESPLGLWNKWRAGAVLGVAVILFFVARTSAQLSSIDDPRYNILAITLILAAAASLILASWHMVTSWRFLRGVLTCLNTLPIKRAFMRPEHLGGARPIWVRRINLQSIDTDAQAMTVLHDMIMLRPDWLVGPLLRDYYGGQMKQLVAVRSAQTRLSAWETRRRIRRISTVIASDAFRRARENWISQSLVGRLEPQTARNEEEQHSRRGALLEIEGDPKSIGALAETFVALHYSPFLTYGVRQIQNLMLFLPAGFVLLVLSMTSYSHQAPQFIGRFLLILFLLIGAAMWTCLTGMERDPILSRINGTTPGELNLESYLKLLGYGALPVIGLLASQFPSISNFLYSAIAPTLQAVH